MFSRNISTGDTLFASEDANATMSRIKVRSERLIDQSWISTLRAILIPRTTENEELEVFFIFHKTQSTVNLFEAENTLVITSLPLSDASELAARYSNTEGWESVPQITDFYRKNFYVKGFINREKRAATAIAANLTMEAAHYLQCSIPKLLPWFFENTELSEQEIKLFTALSRKRGADEYIRCLNEMAKEYNFHIMKTRRMLNKFQERSLEIERGILKDKIVRYRHDIDGCKEKISNILSLMNECNLKLLGLNSNAENTTDELIDYVLCNSHIEINQATPTSKELQFTCKDYVTYFDEELAKKIIENSNSVIYGAYEECRQHFSKEDFETLMKAIFIEKKLKLRFCASYTYRLNDLVYGNKGATYSHECAELYLPNPHIQRYACLGSYENILAELAMENNTIGILEQCVASCKSFSFDDPYVLYEFAKDIRNTNAKCIETQTGESLTPFDAIRFLQQDEQEETNNEQTN